MKNYLLAIERNPHDYMPIPWHLTNLYNDEVITSLEGIDSFTSKMDEETLKQELISESIIDEDMKNNPFVIIFEDNKKIRKLQYGPCFIDEYNAIEFETIVNYIIKNLNNKQLINRIYNAFNNKNYSKELEDILNILNEQSEYSVIQIINHLQNIDTIPYNDIRSLGLFINRTLSNIENLENVNKLTMNKKGE